MGAPLTNSTVPSQFWPVQIICEAFGEPFAEGPAVGRWHVRQWRQGGDDFEGHDAAPSLVWEKMSDNAYWWAPVMKAYHISRGTLAPLKLVPESSSLPSQTPVTSLGV